MEMKINNALIKELRLKKSWSQEKLAEAAELSLRTIQRLENSGIASLQTRIAIATAFDIEPTDLDIESNEEAVVDVMEEEKLSSSPASTLFKTHSSLKLAIRVVLRFLLWIGMVITALGAVSVAIGGFFFWEYSGLAYKASAAMNVMGVAMLIPFFILFFWAFRALKIKPNSTL